MIIYTILNKTNNKTFVKTFDNIYGAEKYRKKIGFSKKLKIVRVIYDI